MDRLIGFFALATCVILCGVGSAIGLYKAGSAASAVIGEDAKKFSKVFILAVLPATQGIYGFVIGIIGIGNIDAGWSLFAATLPMALVGFTTAIFQGLTSVSAILAVAKSDSVGAKMMLFPAMVETYAILSLVISIMLMGNL